MKPNFGKQSKLLKSYTPKLNCSNQPAQVLFWIVLLWQYTPRSSLATYAPLPKYYSNAENIFANITGLEFKVLLLARTCHDTRNGLRYLIQPQKSWG